VSASARSAIIPFDNPLQVAPCLHSPYARDHRNRKMFDCGLFPQHSRQHLSPWIRQNTQSLPRRINKLRPVVIRRPLLQASSLFRVPFHAPPGTFIYSTMFVIVVCSPPASCPSDLSSPSSPLPYLTGFDSLPGCTHSAIRGKDTLSNSLYSELAHK